MKQIKINDETHGRMKNLSEFHGLSMEKLSEAVVLFACEYFEKNGIVLPAMDSIKDIDRVALVSLSEEKSKLGSLEYGNWLSTLSPAEEYALKHCIKSHKDIASGVTKKKNLLNTLGE